MKTINNREKSIISDQFLYSNYVNAWPPILLSHFDFYLTNWRICLEKENKIQRYFRCWFRDRCWRILLDKNNRSTDMAAGSNGSSVLTAGSEQVFKLFFWLRRLSYDWLHAFIHASNSSHDCVSHFISMANETSSNDKMCPSFVHTCSVCAFLWSSTTLKTNRYWYMYFRFRQNIIIIFYYSFIFILFFYLFIYLFIFFFFFFSCQNIWKLCELQKQWGYKGMTHKSYDGEHTPCFEWKLCFTSRKCGRH